MENDLVRKSSSFTYVDLLEVNLLLEHGILRLFPDLDAEGEVGRLDYVAPVASHHDLVSGFVFLVS